MVMIRSVFFLPPLAIARLGGAPTPMDNYEWVEDPTIHGAARNVIEPRTTLEVRQDGTIWPSMPSLLRFREHGRLRPVAPFLELWATVVYGVDDPETHQAAGSAPPRYAPGDTRDVPLTQVLLRRAGADLANVAYTVRVGNRKAARRSGVESDAFYASVKVGGQDHDPHPLLAHSVPQPGSEPLVLPDYPVPLGSFRVIKPVDAQVGEIDLGVLRVRFTPATGQVYGPPTAALGMDDRTERFHRIVPPENRILNPNAAWTRYDADYSVFTNPEPSDTYDGADQGVNRSWGVVDDTCDGVIAAEVVVDGRRHTATARICVGPPDFAPDRRPFLSLADDLADRDLEPGRIDQLLDDEPATQQQLADLFQRIWETADLVNVDAIRSRALRDNTDQTGFSAAPPATGGISMRPGDVPYADDNVRALIPDTGTTGTELIFTRLVGLAHDQLAETDELLSFLVNRLDRLRLMIRPAYGRFSELHPTVAADADPDPTFRDPRVVRDLMHDMRMPPYMRDEMACALGLTRRQYLDLMTYAEHVGGGGQPASPPSLAAAAASESVLAAPAAAPPPPDGFVSPVRRRVEHRLTRIRRAEAAGRVLSQDEAVQ